VPPHDETSPVEPRSGSVRRPPSTRARTGSGGGAGAGGARRPAPPAAGRGGRTTASRSAGGPPGSRPPGARPGAGGGRGGGGKAARTRKQRWRRRLLIALAAVVGLFVLLGVFVGVVYASTGVPDPASVQAAQTTVVYYGDGTTELARLGSKNRTNVKLSQVSEPARDAILAAENRTFYSDPGISFTGILRGAWNTVTGSGTQSGSTITQQYVKNAILHDSSVSFSRKFKELFLAVKLDNNYSKDQILENYLNTIYFGRSAYGIEAAAETYFGVPAAQLTAQQGAVLAVLIRNPSYYDPAAHPQDAQARWGAVLDGMVGQKWLTPAQRQASAYPPVLPRQTGSSLGMPDGPEGLVVSQAIKELESKGYSDEQIYSGGLRITTTVQKKDEDAAINAVNTVMKSQPSNIDKPGLLRQALVATDPKTGAVRAYYGGPKGSGDGAIDYAQTQRQPGSSMKPYTLATGLEQGISVNAIRNGANKVTFPDGRKIGNAGTEACAACTLKEAITESLNTVFYGEALEVGAPKVRQTALAATGLPETWWYGSALKGKKTLSDPISQGVDASIGIGQYEMRPVDQAVGFGTFADGGVYRAPYFVAKVTDGEGKVLVQNGGSGGNQAMPPDVAHDVTYALTGVAAWSHDSLAGGRPSASKTGTQNLDNVDDSDAWMVGYTPSLSAAVWMGSDTHQPIRTAAGRPIYGAGLPGQIWKSFMDAALKGTPVEQLPTSPVITGDKGKPVIAVSTPSPTPTATATATSAPASTTTAAPTTAAATTSAAPTSEKPTTSSAATSTTSSQGGISLPGTRRTPPSGPAPGPGPGGNGGGVNGGPPAG
jgi:membrane peptidoglycan carboxypeptidase